MDSRDAWNRYRRDRTEAALARVMEQARPLVASVCRRVLLREQDVDDAVQRTFVRLLDSSNDGIENVDAWLTVTARNVCLDLARRESRERRRMARHEGFGAAARR